MLLLSGAAGCVIGGLLCSKRTEILGRRLALLSALLITAAGDVLLAVHPTIGFVAVSLFDNVLGPVVECGNCLVSPAVHSQRCTRAREQYLSVFGWDLLLFWGACVRRYCGLGQARIGARSCFENTIFRSSCYFVTILFYVILGLKITND